MNNFQEVFGYNKLLWLLPIHTAVGDGITFPTRYVILFNLFNSSILELDSYYQSNLHDILSFSESQLLTHLPIIRPIITEIQHIEFKLT